ncbi:MAG: NAD(P)-dependent oxidoreductase [Promethearchaeia archaeon]
MSSNKPRVYFTSDVFTPDELGANEQINVKIRKKIQNLWQNLDELANVKVFDGRFPLSGQIKGDIENFNPHIVGCHLSHPIKAQWLKKSDVFAVATSTAGFNHIERPEKEDILITHTPGVLHKTVADYTIALIMANLRNLIDLQAYVWNGNWTPDDKWDLDQNLSSVIDNKTIGIVGLGEIGTELVKRLHPWGLRIIYYDIKRRFNMEEQYSNLDFREELDSIFQEADVVSLHIPLNKSTENLIDADLLKLMKKNALLVNTARGGILDFDDLLTLIENKEIQINLSFDVYPEEPVASEILNRIKKIKKENPERRIILMPHNASADADTRGQMDIIFLNDIISLLESSNLEDLKDINIIKPHRNQLAKKEWKIKDYWKTKN